jgi:hypothetical protein
VIALSPERAGPYLRALAAAVHAAAPHEDFVPLDAALAHLRALDPDLSGDLLAPAEVDPRSGLPAFAWMTRAAAEQAVAAEVRADPERLAAAAPHLAARLRARRALAAHLAAAPLLPALALTPRLRRLAGRTEIELRLDHLDPVGRWVRVRALLSAPPGAEDLGLATCVDGRVQLAPGAADLFARHAGSPLLLLREALAGAAAARVERLSRGRVGPLWFPGLSLPDGVPAALGRGLLLHLVHEVVGADVPADGVADPLDPTPLRGAPPGMRAFRERRLAASAAVLEAARAWAGAGVVVVGF